MSAAYDEENDDVVDLESQIDALKNKLQLMSIVTMLGVVVAVGVSIFSLVANRPSTKPAAVANRKAEPKPKSGDVPDEIRARQFVLVDADGRNCGVLAGGNHGSAMLALGPNGSRTVILLTDGEKDTSLDFFDGMDSKLGLESKGGSQRISLAGKSDKYAQVDINTDDDGWARLNLHGDDPQAGVSLSARGVKDSNISVLAPGEVRGMGENYRQPRFGVSVIDDMSLIMLLAGTSPPACMMMRASSDGKFTVMEIDKDGKLVPSKPTSDE